MEKETVAIAGAIGGVILTAATALAIRQLEKAIDHQKQAAEVIRAERNAYGRGWWEGTVKRLRTETGDLDVFPDTEVA
jgi:hypothetical protein